MKASKNKILAILVYLERRKTRKFVGELNFDFDKDIYTFHYDAKYLKAHLIPLGPDLPLSRKTFCSKTLFESFVDRIPPKENPSYIEYCASQGISPDESDVLVLLATIGSRGPSSFIFEGKYATQIDAATLKKYRQDLNLTIREFASCFEISEKSLVSIENGTASGKEVMKRIEIYIIFPEVALFEFRRHNKAIHINKRRYVEKTLIQKIQESKKTSQT